MPFHVRSDEELAKELCTIRIEISKLHTRMSNRNPESQAQKAKRRQEHERLRKLQRRERKVANEIQAREDVERGGANKRERAALAARLKEIEHRERKLGEDAVQIPKGDKRILDNDIHGSGILLICNTALRQVSEAFDTRQLRMTPDFSAWTKNTTKRSS